MHGSSLFCLYERVSDAWHGIFVFQGVALELWEGMWSSVWISLFWLRGDIYGVGSSRF